MSNRPNPPYPNEGTSANNDGKNTFEVIFPRQDTQGDSSEILRPAQIIQQYINQAEPLSTTKALLDHVLELIAHNWFEGFTVLGASSFYSPFKQMADAVYNLEQHAADRRLKLSILRFLEFVMRKDSEELADAKQAIETLVDHYGSLTNGLHHFHRGTRA